MILIPVLGRIDKPMSTKILALLAVYGKSPTVRQTATEMLRGRRAEDFLDILVSLMIDVFKYEVRSVGGPGSPGVLFVEGQKFNVSRFYAPPAAPEYHSATRRHHRLRRFRDAVDFSPDQYDLKHSHSRGAWLENASQVNNDRKSAI